MISDKTQPTTLHDQLLILSKQAGVVRTALLESKAKVPNNTLEEINNVETQLGYLSKKMETFETVEPIGKRVLIRKDEDKKQTKGGIQLPDNIEIPTITGRIVSVSAEIEMSSEFPLKQYDKVLFNPKGAIPVDFEGDNRLFVVEIENVVAVFRK